MPHPIPLTTHAKDTPRRAKIPNHDHARAVRIAKWMGKMVDQGWRRILVIVGPPHGCRLDWGLCVLGALNVELRRALDERGLDGVDGRVRAIGHNPSSGISAAMVDSIMRADVVGIHGGISAELREMLVSSGAGIDDVEIASLLPPSTPYSA